MNRYSFLLLLAALVVLLLYSEHRKEQNIFFEVKNGERVLTCHMKDGERVIKPEKIVSFDMENRVWFFVNGSSKTCKIGEAK